MTDKSEVVGIVVDKVNLIRRISNIEQLPGESHTLLILRDELYHYLAQKDALVY
jgi:hypothetical protein